MAEALLWEYRICTRRVLRRYTQILGRNNLRFKDSIVRYAAERRSTQIFFRMYKITIHIYGRVQGVGLRWYISQCAEEHNIKGIAQNLPDATVQVTGYGEKDQLMKFIEQCARGSRFSRIDKVTTVWGEAQHAPDNFEII